MRSVLLLLARSVLLLLCGSLFAQNVPKLVDLPKPDLATAVTVKARNARTLSAKRTKVGDPVEFTLEDPVTLKVGDKTVEIPKKAKMTGKVAVASKHDKTNVSMLAYSIDQVTWKDGSIAVRALPTDFDQKDAAEKRMKACVESSSAVNYNRYGYGDPQSEHCRAVAQTHPMILDPNASAFALAEDDVVVESGLVVTFLMDAKPNAAPKQDTATK